MLKDAMLNATGDSDIEDTPLAGQDVDVIDLGHVPRMPVYHATGQ